MSTLPNTVFNVFGQDGPSYNTSIISLPNWLTISLLSTPIPDQQPENNSHQNITIKTTATKSNIKISRFDVPSTSDKVIYVRFPVGHHRFPNGCLFSVSLQDKNTMMTIKSSIVGDCVTETKNSIIKVDTSTIDHMFGTDYTCASSLFTVMQTGHANKIGVKKLAAKLKSGPVFYLFRLPTGHALISIRFANKEDIEIVCNDAGDMTCYDDTLVPIW